VATIFISHKESDVAIAKACVNLLSESLRIDADDIFCSSVPGHQLKFGSTIELQLREGVNEQQILFGILTKDSVRSSWVLFELGAAWAMGRLLIPLVGPGLNFSELPASLSHYPCISIDEPESRVRARIDDALKQVAEKLNVKRKTGAKQVTAVDELVHELSNWKTNNSSTQSNHGLVPIGYTLFQTNQGYSVFRSLNEPIHCICPNCYGKEKKQVLLQGDTEKSTYLFCNACKSNFQLRPSEPINYDRNSRASEWSVRDW
jgi:TIR domain